MPYPRHASGRKWKECARCGLDFPKNELSRDYTGALVCKDCYDIKGHGEHMADVDIGVEAISETYQEDVI